MPADEFSFINQYFAKLNPLLNTKAKHNGLLLGIGDDAALIKMDGTYAITTDTLIENVHFFTNFNPFLLGARTLDVNFSDLYAMGAAPQFVTLSLDIPERYVDFDEFWEPFSRGLESCLLKHNCALIGGNITRVSQKSAPLTISVTAFGKAYVEGKSLQRNQAKVGDIIAVTGTLGANGLYVKSMYNHAIRNLDSEAKHRFEEHAFNYDMRMGYFVERLLNYSQCAIDVSDGLLGDLSHILMQSKVRALLNYESLPLDPVSQALLSELRLSDKGLLKLALSAGGDYNLIFTLSKDNFESLKAKLDKDPKLQGFRVTAIGEIAEARDDYSFDNDLATDGGLVTIVNHKCQEVNLKLGTGSYNHFLAKH